MWDLKTKTNDQTKQKQTHRHREQTDGEAAGGWVRKVKGLRSIERWLQNGHGDVRPSTGNEYSQ